MIESIEKKKIEKKGKKEKKEKKEKKDKKENKEEVEKKEKQDEATTATLSVDAMYQLEYERRERERAVKLVEEQLDSDEIEGEKRERILKHIRKHGLDRPYLEKEGVAIELQEDEKLELLELERMKREKAEYKAKLANGMEENTTADITNEVPGSAEEEDDDESSESDEDEDGTLITPEIDSQLLKTLVRIKNQDPDIYDSKKRFFDQQALEEARAKSATPKKEAPLTLKAIALKKIEAKMQSGSYLPDGDDSEDETQEGGENEYKLSHTDESEKLRRELKAAMFDNDKEDVNDDDEDLFVKRIRTEEEEKDEEQDYKEFLLSEMAQVDSTKAVFQQWASSQTNPNVSEEDRFLMDFVLKRGWIEKEKNLRPTFDEVVADINDEEHVDKAEDFEREYNFRFEDANGFDIINYPRRAGATGAREYLSKSQKKSRRRKQRKLEQAQREEEGLKREKGFYRSKIDKALAELKKVTGNDKLTIKDIENGLDLDHDTNLFNSQFAHSTKDDDDDDNTKPVFDDDIDIGDIEAQQDPEEAKRIQEYAQKLVEGYYQLDHEDKIDDIKTRFKYREVAPVDTGLSALEIIMAEEEDLQKVVPLRAIAPFRESLFPLRPRFDKVREVKRKLLEENKLPQSAIRPLDYNNSSQNNYQNNGKYKARTSSGFPAVEEPTNKRQFKKKRG